MRMRTYIQYSYFIRYGIYIMCVYIYILWANHIYVFGEIVGKSDRSCSVKVHVKWKMGQHVSRTDFEWTYTEEPHASRRKIILGNRLSITFVFAYFNIYVRVACVINVHTAVVRDVLINNFISVYSIVFELFFVRLIDEISY